MSQHDFDITTADANTGVTFRAAVNAALQALASNSSGTTAPSTTYAYMWWADTATNEIKQRNSSNNGWIVRGSLSSAIQEIALGGTGASTAESARLNLDVPSNAEATLKTSSTGSAVIPSGTEAQRDGSPSAGYLRFNTDIDKPEIYNGTAWSPVGFSAPSTYIDQSALLSGSQTNLVVPDVSVMVGGTLVAISASTVALGTSGNWDNSTYSTAANRAGKDFYIYAKQAGGVILSANSTYPTGYTADNTRKVGGFHCLGVAVGTISGHTLTGYVAGDILPRSVWDRFNRSSARQEGTILSSSGMWVDIYLPSVAGSTLVSVYGGTIADGTSSPAFHCYKFEQWFGRQGMKTISQLEFVAASIGANQGTNIAGSSDPGTTGGHTDTAGRRMISNEGCEDMCGVLWQWTRDMGGNMTAASWANAYDGNDSGVGGQHYQAPFRGVLGGYWAAGVHCGSRGSVWDGSPLHLDGSISARGVAEPASSRF